MKKKREEGGGLSVSCSINKSLACERVTAEFLRGTDLVNRVRFREPRRGSNKKSPGEEEEEGCEFY